MRIKPVGVPPSGLLILYCSENCCAGRCCPFSTHPDSFLKEFGGEAFRELIAGAEGFFDFNLSYLCTNNYPATDRGRIIVAKSMAEAVHKTGDAVQIDAYAQKTALRLGVAVDAVRKEFSKLKSKNVVPDDNQNLLQDDETVQPSIEEFGFLQLVFQTDDHIEWLSKHFNAALLKNKLVRDIVGARIKSHRKTLWQGMPQFLESLGDEKLVSLITKAVSLNCREISKDHKRGRMPLKPFEELQALAWRTKKAFMDVELRKLEGLRSTLEPTSPEQIAVIQKIAELKAISKNPL